MNRLELLVFVFVLFTFSTFNSDLENSLHIKCLICNGLAGKMCTISNLAKLLWVN